MGRLLSEIGRQALKIKSEGKSPRFVLISQDKFDSLQNEIKANYLLYQRVSRLFSTRYYFGVKIADVTGVVVTDQASAQGHAEPKASQKDA